MIKDLISDNVIEVFKLILEKHEFDKGLSIMKYFKQINSGTKFVLMNAEEGRLWLEKKFSCN